MKNYIDKQYLIDKYELNKNIAQYYYDNNNIERSLAYYTYAATIAWKYPILYKFVDDVLEQKLDDISKDIFCNLNDNIINNIKAKNIVLYSGQIVDKGGLTEQYLHYFIEKGYNVLLIVPFKSKTHSGNNIINYVSSYSNCAIYIPKSNELKQKIIEIRNVINDYKPNKIFIHFMPNDVVGYCALSGLNIKKYYIVHNDHTFWIGKNCSDYFIEFRDYGISLSYYRRGIPLNKIIQIAYYPIIDNNIEFQGFPFDIKNKIIGISGANLYKYYMDKELKYFHAIKELIYKNDDFVFCLCGWGDNTIIYNFINKYKLQNRFYYLGKRNDFSELINNSHILFESYPLKGGLVMLYATNLKKPVIGIANYNNASGSIEDFISINNYKQPTNIEDFKEEANKLIKYEAYRSELGDKLSNNNFNKSSFTKYMTYIMENNNIMCEPKYIKKIKINDTEYLSYYINMQDNVSLKLALDNINIIGFKQSFKSLIGNIVIAIKNRNTSVFKIIVRMIYLCINK